MLMIERDGKLAEATRQEVTEPDPASDQPAELLACPPIDRRSLLERLVALDYRTFAAPILRRPF